MMTNEEINRLIQELEKLKKLKTPEQKWIEIPDCNWYFDLVGKIWANESKTNNLKYGYKRTTTKACELASKRMIRTNRLSLLAHILDVEQEFVSGEDNYYLLQPTGKEDAEWSYACHKYTYCPDRVYMTKEGIKSVCTILNNNDWDLEVNDDN